MKLNVNLRLLGLIHIGLGLTAWAGTQQKIDLLVGKWDIKHNVGGTKNTEDLVFKANGSYSAGYRKNYGSWESYSVTYGKWKRQSADKVVLRANKITLTATGLSKEKQKSMDKMAKAATKPFLDKINAIPFVTITISGDSMEMIGPDGGSTTYKRSK